ncbi:unnamed protein product [Lasius platythorax]|uniref:Uncharacterized protein n=1 Tax=Lasius platythorax TaxID=488582 RepID=A0AAV2NAA2_9HYME
MDYAREAGYSAAADRVGRQQRRGRGPDPGRRDKRSNGGTRTRPRDTTPPVPITR